MGELLRNGVEIDWNFVTDRENGANQCESSLAQCLLSIGHGIEQNDVDS